MAVQGRNPELPVAGTMDEVQDGKVTVVGPDINEIPEGSTIPFGMIFKVAGELIEKGPGVDRREA